jgi:hypothetical protein
LTVQIQGAGSPPIVDADTLAWAGLTGSISAVADWLVGSGALAWTTDPARVLNTEVAASSASPGAASASSQPSPAPGGAAAAAAAGAPGGEAGDAAAAASGVVEDAPAEEGAPDWRLDGVVPLLYHPAAVRSPVQKRTQVLLLKELVRALRSKFNDAFEKLRADKLDVLQVRGVCVRVCVCVCVCVCMCVC